MHTPAHAGDEMEVVPVLVLVIEGQPHTAHPERPTVLGSAPDADIRVAAGPAYWVRFRYAAGWAAFILPREGTAILAGKLVRPLGSESRVMVRLASEEEQPLNLRHFETTLRIGVRIQAQDGPETRILSGLTPNPTAPTTPSLQRGSRPDPNTISLRSEKIVIGRTGSGADIEIPGIDVASRHTTVRWNGQAAVVRDLRGGTGTYVNGHPVIQATVPASQEFIIGHSIFRVKPDGTLEQREIAVPAVLSVRGLGIRHHRNTTPTLSDISFELPRGGLMAIIGPSGVGKSTLFAGLLGEAEVVAGYAHLDGVPLGGSGGPSPVLVSFVPQQDATFGELTVRETLRYCADLRLARDVTKSGRDNRIADVEERLQLSPLADRPAGTLSGGERRRLNVAMELLSKPLLLMLDEPTSGLDEGLDRMLMDDLTTLASEGCVVMIVTHSTAHLGLATSALAVASHEARGTGDRPPSSVGFFGSPGDLLDGFAAASYADVMNLLRDGGTARPSGSAAGQPFPALSPTSAGGNGTSRAPSPRVMTTGRALTVNLRREVRRLSQRWKSLIGLTVAQCHFFK